MQEINQNLVDKLDQIREPQELLKEVFNQFGDRAAIGTSGQLTGVAIIDIAAQAGVKPRVFTIDTLRLFPETYDLFNEVEKKYNIKIEKIKPDDQDLEKMISEHGEYLFFDSKEKQELCCHVRKVRPNQKVLDTLDVWLTGLRVDQSRSRANRSRFEIIAHGEEKRPILKISPLLDWTEDDLRKYIKENDVPMHSLLSWNQSGWFYESLGCKICTTPISEFEPRRAGRWRWFKDDDKECGLHVTREIED